MPARTMAPVPVGVAAVPMANVPDVVMGEPVMVRKEGTVMATEVTLPPPPDTVVQVKGPVPPEDVRTWPDVPVVAGRVKS